MNSTVSRMEQTALSLPRSASAPPRSATGAMPLAPPLPASPPSSPLGSSILRMRDAAKNRGINAAPPYSANYASLTDWVVDEAASPEVLSAYIEVVKFIVLREAALEGLRSLLRSCGEAYWRYALLLVEPSSSNSIAAQGQDEEMSRLLKSVQRYHAEMTISLAHIRSLGVSVVESLRSWRRETAKRSQIKDVISIHWKGQNYLLKMADDLHQILDDPLMKMWLGFEPNAFMLPPPQHNPASSWKRLEARLQDWLTRYRMHKKGFTQIERARRPALIVKSSTTANRTQEDPLPASPPDPAELPPGPSTGGDAADINVEPSEAAKEEPSAVCFDDSLVEDGIEDEEVKSGASDAGQVEGDATAEEVEEDVEQEEGEKAPAREEELQHVDVANDPENALDESDVYGIESISHNLVGQPAESDASSSGQNGSSIRLEVFNMQETFDIDAHEPSKPAFERGSEELLAPKNATRKVAPQPLDGAHYIETPAHSPSLQDLVTPTQRIKVNSWQDLREICSSCWKPDVEGGSHPFWDNMQLHPRILQAAIGFPEAFPSKYIIPILPDALVKQCLGLEEDICSEHNVMEILHLKRAGCNEYRFSVASELSSKGIDVAMRTSMSESARDLQRRLKYRQQHSVAVATSTHSPSCGGAPLSSNVVQEASVTNGYNENDFAVFLTSVEYGDSMKIPEKIVAAMEINKEALKNALEHKLAQERELTQVVGSSVVLVKSRRSRKAAVEQMRVTPAVTMIQKVYRGHRARREVKKKHTAWKKIYSVWLIQRAARRMIAVQRARRLKLVYRRDCFLARREILHKNKAAFIITKFIRSAAFLMSKLKAALQVSSVERTVLRKTIIEYNASTIALQSLWRGKLARRNTRLLLNSDVIKLVKPSAIMEAHSECNSDEDDSYQTNDSPNARDVHLSSSVGSVGSVSGKEGMAPPAPSLSPTIHRRAMQGSSSSSMLPGIESCGWSKHNKKTLMSTNRNRKTKSLQSSRLSYDPKFLNSGPLQNGVGASESLWHSNSLPTLDAVATNSKGLRMRAVRPERPLNVDEVHRAAFAARSMVLTNPSLTGKSISTQAMLNVVTPPAHAAPLCAPPSREFSIRDILLPSLTESSNVSM